MTAPRDFPRAVCREWIPVPLSFLDRTRGSRPVYRLFERALRRSGRLEAIYRARSEAEQHRLIVALFRGRRPVEIAGTDAEIATWAGMGPRSVSRALRDLEAAGYCTRERRGRSRRIRLCLPAAGGGP